MISDVKERNRLYKKKYREKNRELLRINDRIRYKKDDKIKQRNKEKYHKRKEAVWKRNIFRKYGIKVEQYQELEKQQNYCCAICGLDNSKEKKKLNIDHCHKSGKIRGLLCTDCNNGLGRFKDDIISLANAIRYLENSR